MKIARTIGDNGKETFLIVNSDHMAITRAELKEQTSLEVPKRLETFLFSKYYAKIKSTKLKFTHKFEEFKILPPINKPYKIICLAFNYTDQDSWIRFGKTPPKDPVIHIKPRTSLIGPFDDIVCPTFVKQLDYEGELAVLIGKNCKNVTTANALDYVCGYFILNDVSARDIQFIDTQLTRAKGFDTFGPCGPWVTTADEVPNPCDLALTTKINGTIRQNSSTKNLVLKVDEIISNLSRIMTLEEGDIISTGTPTGTALSLSSSSGQFLHDGDVVEVQIETLGKIKNKISFVDQVDV